MKIEAIFEKYNDEYSKFERVENKRPNRPDLHAFLLLDELFPGKDGIVFLVRSDEIWLNIDYEDIEKLTELQILELVRCDVGYDDGSLCLFV